MQCDNCGKDVDDITQHNKEFHQAMEDYDYDSRVTVKDLWEESDADQRTGYLAISGINDPSLSIQSFDELPPSVQRQMEEISQSAEGYDDDGNYEEKCDKCGQTFDNPADAGSHGAMHDAEASEGIDSDLDEIMERSEDGVPDDIEEVYQELLTKGYAPQTIKDALSGQGGDISGLESYAKEDVTFAGRTEVQSVKDLWNAMGEDKRFSLLQTLGWGADETYERLRIMARRDWEEMPQLHYLDQMGDDSNVEWLKKATGYEVKDPSLKKEIDDLERFIQVASMENPMNLEEEKAQLKALKNQYAGEGREPQDGAEPSIFDEPLSDDDYFQGKQGEEADNYPQKDFGTLEDWNKELETLKKEFGQKEADEDYVEAGWIEPYYKDGWLGKKPKETNVPDTDNPDTFTMNGESWDDKTFNYKVETFESIGFIQADALKMANMSWHDISKEVRQAVEVEEEEKEEKRDSTQDAFNDANMGAPDDDLDYTDIDYNTIPENPLAKEKFNCEWCTSGFKSNEALMTHYNDIHARANEYYIEIPNKCHFCGEELDGDVDMETHLAYQHALAPNSGLDIQQGIESDDAGDQMRAEKDTLDGTTKSDQDNEYKSGFPWQEGEESETEEDPSGYLHTYKDGLDEDDKNNQQRPADWGAPWQRGGEAINPCPDCGRNVNDETDNYCPTCGHDFTYAGEVKKKKISVESYTVLDDIGDFGNYDDLEEAKAEADKIGGFVVNAPVEWETATSSNAVYVSPTYKPQGEY